MSLRDKLLSDFACIPYPGDAAIALRTWAFVEYEGEEGHSVEVFFRGKRWQDISLAKLRGDYKGDASACLCFMTPEAFRYFLPSYLLICVDEYEQADVLYDATIWQLTPGADEDVESREIFFQRFDDYNYQQKRTIALFLQAMSALHGADRASDEPKIALEAYWGKYLD